MLIRAFIFDQLLLKVFVTQLIINQPLFWLYNNGEQVKSHNLNQYCYNSLEHVYKIRLVTLNSNSATQKQWCLFYISKMITQFSIFQLDNNCDKWVFNLDSTNTRHTISIMHNYRNQHESDIMLTRHSCWDWMPVHCVLCENLRFYNISPLHLQQLYIPYHSTPSAQPNKMHPVISASMQLICLRLSIQES